VRALRDEQGRDEIPIFNDAEYPVINVEKAKNVGWPRGRDVMARGILAMSMKGGGIDLADGSVASRDSIRDREYHHLFPDSLLLGDGGLLATESSRALNCALITWKTNRNIGAKEPIKYLRERIDSANLGEAEIRHRLGSHAIPFDHLNVGGYSEILDSSARSNRIRSDYENFLTARAEVLSDAASRLCNGEPWAVDVV